MARQDAELHALDQAMRPHQGLAGNTHGGRLLMSSPAAQLRARVIRDTTEGSGMLITGVLEGIRFDRLLGNDITGLNPKIWG